MSTRSSIPDAVDTDRTAGTVELLEPPREAVEWMASPAPATDLWWTATVCGEADPDWHRLETTAQIADLVHALTDPQDKLVLEDDAGRRLRGRTPPGIMAP